MYAGIFIMFEDPESAIVTNQRFGTELITIEVSQNIDASETLKPATVITSKLTNESSIEQTTSQVVEAEFKTRKFIFRENL